MPHTDVLIIGGGQAGLAMSYCLSQHSIAHVILERGRLAERWRSERWDSLRLLTPNWLSRLPGWSYKGPSPDGYMSCAQLVGYLEDYAAHISAPLQCETKVLSLSREDAGFEVVTNCGTWRASIVVVATGYANSPAVPNLSRALPSSIEQFVPTRYRKPDDLPPGGVLVVGAAATGVQLAEEIHASGRSVSLCVGKHTRLPRRYRGRDILWWLDAMGLLDERAEDAFDIERARSQPSLQLVGRDEGSNIDLLTLQKRGVRLLGRALDVSGGRLRCADDLRTSSEAAARKLERLLGRIDSFAGRNGLSDGEESPPLAEDIQIDRVPTELDLQSAGIKSVLWCTGYRRSYPWLHIPAALDARGELRHRDGITHVPGLYALGLAFMQRRSSSFIDGVGRDAEFLIPHIRSSLDRLIASAKSAA